MPMGLPRRLAVLTAVMAILLVTGATEVALVWSARTRLEDLRLEAVSLANTLASLLVRSAPKGDPAGLAQGLEGWARHRGPGSGAMVYVLRHGGLLPVAASGLPDSTAAEPAVYHALARRAAEEHLRSGDDPGWQVLIPLGLPHPYGVLDMRLSTRRLQDWARLERRRAYMLAFLSALLVALFVAVMTARWVGRPLAASAPPWPGRTAGRRTPRRRSRSVRRNSGS